MKEKAITVTEAARNFADCVNRVHYQNMSFVLLKNGVPFARLVPDNMKACSGREFAEALAKVELTVDDARTWRRDLHSARSALRSPRDKWR